MGYLIAFSSDLIQKKGKNRDLNQYPLLSLNFTLNNYTFLFKFLSMSAFMDNVALHASRTGQLKFKTFIF